jgi:hypothetical protein
MIGFAEFGGGQGGGRMKKPLLGLVVVLSVFLAGCPVSDLHPLYNDGDNVSEPDLVGKWVSPDSSNNGSLSFEKSAGSAYSMIVNDPDQGVTDTYEVHLVRLGGNLFGDIRFSKRVRAGNNSDMPVGMISGHLIVKLVIKNDDLAVSTMEDDLLEKNSATDKPSLAYQDHDPDGVLVTSDTEALRRYVTAHGTDGFSEPDHWNRAH